MLKTSQLRITRAQFHLLAVLKIHLPPPKDQRMTSSPPPTGGELVSASESQLSSVVYYLSENAQVVMGNMLKMTNDIDQNSAGITEEIEKSKDAVLQRKLVLEEEKDHFQKAALAVLDMLHVRDIN
ncbi:hypothetical protein CASFOL_007249 [Castilleja foliolosa]|uniref:Uncharacterized protein n=1 Tax=Castilleja foliolosa TaxID=1961234 RepID=A0ABD3ECI1_9LAMI